MQGFKALRPARAFQLSRFRNTFVIAALFAATATVPVDFCSISRARRSCRLCGVRLIAAVPARRHPPAQRFSTTRLADPADPQPRGVRDSRQCNVVGPHPDGRPAAGSRVPHGLAGQSGAADGLERELPGKPDSGEQLDHPRRFRRHVPCLHVDSITGDRRCRRRLRAGQLQCIGQVRTSNAHAPVRLPFRCQARRGQQCDAAAARRCTRRLNRAGTQCHGHGIHRPRLRHRVPRRPEHADLVDSQHGPGRSDSRRSRHLPRVDLGCRPVPLRRRPRRRRSTRVLHRPLRRDRGPVVCSRPSTPPDCSTPAARALSATASRSTRAAAWSSPRRKAGRWRTT